MSLRSFRKRPPFPFVNRARPDDLPCVPCITQRGTHPTFFAELRMFVGPQEIAVTGDNSFDTLFGRVWAILFCDDGTWHTLQWVGADDLDPATGITSSGWRELADPLLSLPPLTAGVQQRWSAAFDQNARLIVAYETNGTIDVTRWDSDAGEYRQNVTFAGRDPQLLIDAALTDPRFYPNLADDGWSVREAFDAGVRVWLEWLPDATFRTTAIPDSDVLLFYLNTDRTKVMARVQRELYGVEREIHDFGQSVVLDHAIALGGRYQILVSDQVGARLPETLVSDPYLGDFVINPQPRDAVTLSASVEAGEYTQPVIAPSHTRHALDLLVQPAPAAHVNAVQAHEARDALTLTANVQSAGYDLMVVPHVDGEGLDLTTIVEDALHTEMVIPATARHALTLAVSVQRARYQEAT